MVKAFSEMDGWISSMGATVTEGWTSSMTLGVISLRAAKGYEPGRRKSSGSKCVCDSDQLVDDTSYTYVSEHNCDIVVDSGKVIAP